jgi:hypothetical protein
MIYKKPQNLKYTDLCVYIDQNVPKIANPGEYPEIEATVYNYLWLLVKALAIKKCMFNKFEDYDGYAFYAATRLFLALRKNYLNQGKIIKGKQIKPIKSCLNYTKALLYPMKIEYQRETFKEIIEEEFVSKKFDAFAYGAQLKSEVRDSSDMSAQLKLYLRDALSQKNKILDELLKKSPFGYSTPEYKNLKISILLNSINILHTKKKLVVTDQQSVILWHLPKNMTNYVKILVKEFFTALKLEIMDCCKETNITDDTLDAILHANLEETYFEEQH